MKLFLFTVILFASITSLYADSEGEAYNAAKHYAALSNDYEKSFLSGKHKKAYLIAVEQLKLDPADTAAYLRMAIASQYLDVDKIMLIKKYSPAISERDVFHIQVKSIANILLSIKKDKKD